MDHYLPGFEPSYVRIDLTRAPRGYWTLSTYLADGPGFVKASDLVRYETMTLLECADVIASILDGFSGGDGAAA